MASEQQSVEPDIPAGSSGSMSGLKEDGLVLQPVADGASGEGLPYAPINWPNPGDVWAWKVGKRKNNLGFMADRYLYLPLRLKKSIPGKSYFASLQSLKEFLRKEFPDADMEAFFASFSWKVPAKDHCWDSSALPSIYPLQETDAYTGQCKARNKTCDLQLEAETCSVPTMDCDICCNEAGFCRNCCCILCSRTIDWAYDGYSYIRCEAKLSESYICGHAGHIDCALRSYMAGTVGGSIGLDAEYYCRRCDYKTDLISHAAKLLKTCQSLDSRDEVEKILKMGLCILRGSQRESAGRLLSRIDLALTKIRTGTSLEDIWNVESSNIMVIPGQMHHFGNNGTSLALEATYNQYPNGLNNVQRGQEKPMYITTDYKIESIKLEDEIDQVLQDLRRSQEIEYRMAEEKLYAQKDVLVSLYQQLDVDRSELAKRTSSTMDCDVDETLANISTRINQIKKEVAKLKEMEEVAKGFGRTHKAILSEHFGFQFDD